MTVADEIFHARGCGVVHCGLSAIPSPSLADFAGEFGLAAVPASYCQISAEAARQLAQLILQRDMTYGVDMMPARQAADLAERFLAQFDTEGTRFYTNGTFYEGGSSASWNPVTAATFDTGILIIGVRFAGCFWVEDED